MSCLGVLFAVGEDIIDKMRSMPAESLPEYISEKLEELYFEEYPEMTCELDKSWDAMHRALTDGKLSFDSEGTLALAILGGERLYFDEDHTDYIITAKSPAQVGELYKALTELTDEEFEKRYNAIPDGEYGEFKSAEDLEYTLEYLHDSLSFWRYAAEHGLWVLFTADQ